jgi:hypothetical protein
MGTAAWLTRGAGKRKDIVGCAAQMLKFEAYSNHRAFRECEHRDDKRTSAIRT